MQIIKKKLSFTLILILFNHNVFGSKPSCDVSITAPVNFGVVNPYDYTPKTTLGQVQVTCTGLKKEDSVTYTLSFSILSNASRVIKSGTNSVSYNLYRDSGYTQILGDGSNGTVVISNTRTDFDSNFTDTYTIYGRIPIQPVAIVGNYSDNISVQLQY